MNTSDDQDKSSKTGDNSSSAGSSRSIPLLGNRIDSRELFVGGREITIMHGAEAYRLRLTAQNKLILTK
jgi:hemin uptake protein HemP